MLYPKPDACLVNRWQFRSALKTKVASEMRKFGQQIYCLLLFGLFSSIGNADGSNALVLASYAWIGLAIFVVFALLAIGCAYYGWRKIQSSGKREKRTVLDYLIIVLSFIPIMYILLNLLLMLVLALVNSFIYP